jgi:putative methionine-R-sulfoxide reductase with GAF domain
LGVLDVDSPKLARFDQEDGVGLKGAAELLLQSADIEPFSNPSAPEQLRD